MKYSPILLMIILCLLIVQQVQTIYRYQLAIGAMFQNEGPYLKEWLEFHKLVGVEHFYLYNNNSTDNYQQILQSYIDNKEVTLIQWRYKKQNWLSIQLSAYTDAIKKAAGQAKWLALLDLDEFLFPVEKDTLTSFLADYEQCVDIGGVCVNWQMYGTSSVNQLAPGKLLIETLLFKAPTEHPENRLGKVIVRPERIDNCNKSTHIHNYKPGYFQVTPHKEQCIEKLMPSITTDKIRINHYWTRTHDHFMKYKLPRRLRFGDTQSACLERLRIYNQIKDPTIMRFVPILKQKLVNK